MRVKASQILFLLVSIFLVQPTLTIGQKNEITYAWDIPKLKDYRVHDDAGILSSSSIKELESMLKGYEDSTSNQIAILSITKLGDKLESYSRKVFNEWKLGQSTKNNGVLILVVEDDRKIRIEVGEGLEKILTGEFCNRVINEKMVPEFKEKNYDAGMLAAVTSIMNGINGIVEVRSGFNWRIVLWAIYGITLIVAILGLLSKDFATPTFAVVAPFQIIGAYINFLNWWMVLTFAIAYPLLRFLITKAKLNFLNFGLNPGKREFDTHDEIRWRNMHKSTEWNDSSNDSFSSDSGSNDSGGKSGSW